MYSSVPAAHEWSSDRRTCFSPEGRSLWMDDFAFSARGAFTVKMFLRPFATVERSNGSGWFGDGLGGGCARAKNQCSRAAMFENTTLCKKALNAL